MAKFLFDKDMMKEIIDSPKVIKDEIIDNTRWSIIHSLIFEHEGRFYRTGYSVGATEYQDEQPFDYYDDGVECWEVEEREVLRKEWFDKDE